MSTRPEHDRFELLAAADKVARGTQLLEDTVARLLGLVVPAFADIATLDSISPDGELRRLGSRVDAPRRREELEAALLRRRPLPDAPVGLPRAIVSAESQLLPSVTDEQLRLIASSEEDFELLRALELRSALFIPLRARGRTVGALALGVGTSGRSYDQDDLRYAEIVSGRLALALDNATLAQTVTGLERRLEATLTNLAEAVLVREPGGQIVFANSAAARLLSLSSVGEVTAATPEQLMALYDVSDEAGRSVDLADLPSSRAGRGEESEPLLVRNVSRATGEERWLLHKATPVFDADGSLLLIVSVVEDLTEVKRAELAQRLLAEAGQELSSSLDYEQTLQRVAQLTVPRLADSCGVVMRGEDGDLAQVAIAHAHPDQVTAHECETRVAEVIRTGRAQMTTDSIVAPLAIADQPPIGALSLAMAESGRTFAETDLALAAELGRRAAAAVENARLYSERSEIATTLQQSLLPPDLPAIPGFRLASLYRAAGEHNDVGGDFYDAFEVPGGWMVIVGDVAGRGAEAAALTALSRYTFRTAGKLLGNPIAALAQLNAALRERSRLSLVSVCCVMLRDGDPNAELVLAGHPPAYHLREGSSRPVGVFAPFLGAYEHGGWEPTTVRLEPGDQLVLYTDGVIDTVGRAERFGEERLAQTLCDATGAADAVRRIDHALVAFAHGSQVDDTAVIAVERSRGEADAGGGRVVAMGLESLATSERSVPMIEPYQVVGLISTMRGIRRREEISWNLEHISHMVKAASWLSSMDLPVRLICIPEGGLQGFTDEVLDLDHETYARECAIDIPGPETDYLGRLAQQWNAYVIAQAKARHPEFPGRFFNVGFVIEPEDGTVILRHHKLVPLLPVEHSVTPHNVWDRWIELYGRELDAFYPVADTEIGRIGIMMANEASYPENARGLAMNGCEIAYRGPYPAPGVMSGMFGVQNRARALDNNMYVIGMNLGTYYLDKDSGTPIDTFSGGSQIVDYRGQVVTEVPYGAGSTWIAGTIDIEALRNFRQTAQWDNWMKDLTTEQYQLVYEQPVYPKNLYLDRAPFTHAEYREQVTRRQVELLQERGVWARPGRPAPAVG